MTVNYRLHEAALALSGGTRMANGLPARYGARIGRWLVVGCCLLGLSISLGCSRQTAPTLSYNDGNATQLRKLLQAGQKGGGAAAVSAAEPTGWANLKGRFTLTGSPPARVPLNANKDMEVCVPGGVQPLDQGVVIGPENGIQNVLIYLSSVAPPDNPKWEHESYAGSKSGEVVFDQKNCVFQTHVAAMRATQKMRVLNSDPVGHNTNLDSKRGSAAANFTVAALTTVPANAPAYVPLKSCPAPFGVSCSIHPWMKAWLMVCDTPYFAVTKNDGTFEIKNIPAGVPLDFRVWQERAGYVQAVTVDGTASQWKRGKFTLTLNNDETKELNVSIDATVFK